MMDSRSSLCQDWKTLPLSDSGKAAAIPAVCNDIGAAAAVRIVSGSEPNGDRSVIEISLNEGKRDETVSSDCCLGSIGVWHGNDFACSGWIARLQCTGVCTRTGLLCQTTAACDGDFVRQRSCDLLHLCSGRVRTSRMRVRSSLLGFMPARHFWTEDFDLQVAVLWTLCGSGYHQAW